MVTLQTPDSKRNESEDGNCHENNSRLNNVDKRSCLELDSCNKTVPLNHGTVTDFTVHHSDVDDGDSNDLEIIEIEDEIDEYEMEHEEEKAVADKVGWMQKTQHETPNGQILPHTDNTTYSEVCVTNSTNVRVGNTTLYKGPVTIKQFVYTNSNSLDDDGRVITDDGVIGTGQLCDNTLNEKPFKGGLDTFTVFREYNKVKRWLWTWRCAAIMCILGLIIVTSIVVLSIVLTQRSEFTPNFTPMDPDDVLVDGVRFIQRVEWGAQPAEGLINKLNITPVPYVIISHTATEACYTQTDCIQRVRLAQMMHIEINHWSDIGYNFLVGGDGLVYVGRGWDDEGAHSFGFNRKSMGICMIGTFTKFRPPTKQLHSLAKLIAIGIKKNKIRDDYKLLGHCQVSATKSPGAELYGLLQQWDHWSEKP